MDKILIAYFSRKGDNYVNGNIISLPIGNTEVAAKKIQKFTKGDLFEIQTIHPYAEDYRECVKESQREIQENLRPELKESVSNFNEYDVIYLGFPNWCGTCPMAVITFLGSYDFAGKTIMPFCTNEGSKMGHSEKDIKEVCPSALVLSGLSIHGGSVEQSDDDILNWIEQSGVEKIKIIQDE